MAQEEPVFAREISFFLFLILGHGAALFKETLCCFLKYDYYYYFFVGNLKSFDLDTNIFFQRYAFHKLNYSG